jgi:hypothetical protein
MMHAKSHLFPVCLTLLMSACGPGSNQASQPEARSPGPAAASADSGKAGGQDDAPVPTTPAADSRYRVGPGQVGAIKTGMPTADLEQVIPAGQLRETSIHLEGQAYKAYEVNLHGGGVLVEETCDPACLVWRIQVRNPAYRTAEGLGVGSSLGEVKKHYPISFLGSGETEIVAVSNQKKITFMLDVSHLPPQQVPWLNLQNTPDSVKVLGMLIL